METSSSEQVKNHQRLNRRRTDTHIIIKHRSFESHHRLFRFFIVLHQTPC
ncbi:hypothetical protein L249_4154 [Ophiocordyceps polyrhachis-furcata BCC 54312]|uniref:Uncharacterized protein n=1 Tax=Ophiocordyceps polyrhachis-furcata BCC 54312 TaxID=1330021 RepID=A0A367L5T0_9HYPO|nr:hypothetical protein L249_4154 [Ophiocordyceps polyrhachis-furcata BCC 54312]